MIRSAAVAGQFYPAQPKALRQELDSFLTGKAKFENVIGVVSPHAGYVYSGAIAGQTISSIHIPAEVIILGPNHRGQGHPGAVYASGYWQTPLGEVAVAEGLAQSILADCPELADDSFAHTYEHSLEVQVPFLQAIREDVRIVPICLSHWSLEQLIELGSRLGRLINKRADKPLILASSDMSHYEPGDVARIKDHQAIDRILALDPEGLYRVVRDNRISMCGVIPTVVMLAAALVMGATSAELIRYGNSGDVTGDQSEVVGYAGLVVY
jgi:AmmeMemoRadiSam system protein B